MSEPGQTISTGPLLTRPLSFGYRPQGSVLHSPARKGWIEDGPAIKPVRLLIVDRNPEVRRALAARLGSSKRIVVLATVAGAGEAVRQTSSLTPDVVLLDSRSLGQSGAIDEVVHALRGRRARIVVLATYPDESEREAFLKAGADRYLLKDIDSAALIAEIGQVAAEA